MSVSSVPRPVIIALIGGVLLLAAFMLTRGGGSGDSSSSNEFETPPPANNTTTQPQSEGAKPSDTKSSTDDKSAAGDSDKSSSQQGSGSATDESAAASDVPQAPGGKNGLPAGVQKALDQRKVVVILFWRPNAVDDRQVHQAVEGLRGRSKAVRVFTAGVGEVDRYVSIVGPDGVTQTPALVVVDRKGKADVQTGFIDEKTVENTVYNAI